MGEGNTLACAGCATEFPVHLNGEAPVPWLYADPLNARREWQARFNGFTEFNATEQKRLRSALGDPSISAAGRDRVHALLEAREVHHSQVTALLEPMGLNAASAGSVPAMASSAKVPQHQGLSSYYANIFRDWAWQNGEHEGLLEALESVLPRSRLPFARALTLGAGAGRLPYDFHIRHQPELSVALDINPLLTAVAARVASGETVPMVEFPIAPFDGHYAVAQDCRAPIADSPGEKSHDNLLFMLADGMTPPFRPASFDAVITPWLIDIMPQDLRTFIPRINRLLEHDGVWMNTGTCAFFHGAAARCYSEEEVVALVENNGFELLSVTHCTLPYLKSPFSGHGRTERIFSFSARKIADVEVGAAYQFLPTWLTDTDCPMPENQAFTVTSANHLLKAQVLGAIDGQRSVDELGALVAKQYGLQVEEAVAAVQRIVIDAFEATSRNNPFS